MKSARRSDWSWWCQGPDLPDNATLMRIADRTMQEVKRDGGGVRLYDPDSDTGGSSSED